MGRFIRSYIYRIITAIVWLIQSEEAGQRDEILRAVAKYRSGNPTQDDLVYRALTNYSDPVPDEDPSNLQVLQAAVSQCRKKKTDDMDLIETMVSTLQLEAASNHFYPQALKALRDAILRPDEIGAWKALVRSGSKCPGCNHIFTNSEGVTVSINNDGSRTLYCNACMRSSYVRCDKCDQITVDKTRNAKVDCGCSKNKPAEILRETDDIYRRMVQAAGDTISLSGRARQPRPFRTGGRPTITNIGDDVPVTEQPITFHGTDVVFGPTTAGMTFPTAPDEGDND